MAEQSGDQGPNERALLVIRELERDYWRARADALERIVGARSPALAKWFDRVESNALAQATRAFPDEPITCFQVMIATFQSLQNPRKLTGAGRKYTKLDRLLPYELLRAFEIAHQMLTPFCGADGKPLLAKYLVPMWQALHTPKDRQMSAKMMREWMKSSRSV